MTDRILTANRLTDGVVLYLAETGWTPDIFAARRAGDDGAAAALLADGRAAVARNEVADAYLIEFEDDRPVRRREEIRRQGPTVRADLGYQSTRSA